MVDLRGIAREALRRSGTAFEHFAVLELNRPGAAGSGVALLVFTDGEPRPRALIKATDDPERARRLSVEHDNLETLRRLGGAAVRGTVPAPLYHGRLEGLSVLAETALPGQRMKNLPPDAYYRSAAFRRHLARVTDWLTGLRRALAGGGLAARPGADAAAAVERFRARFRRSPALERLLDEARERLAGSAPPAAPWHGDFCSANILLGEGGDIAVVDWEYPLAAGWPLSDLLYFFCSVWCVRYRRGRAAALANHRRLFFEPHALAGTLRRAAQAYLQDAAIPRELGLALSALAWVDYANRKAAELESLGAGGGAEHLPLILLEDGRCLNLELLAEHRASFLLDRAD